MPEFENEAARLSLGAVDALPAGDLERRLAGDEPMRVKLGIDPTAPDIHLGHVVVLEKLRQFQAAGHTAVMIIGDYTARVGDPSGRSNLRPALSPDQIDANAKTFTQQAFKVLDPELTEVRFNSEWLEMPTHELFDLARRFTVARLLERDDFSKPHGSRQPVSMLELLYPVLQGYDSVADPLRPRARRDRAEVQPAVRRATSRGLIRPAPASSIMTLPILPGTDGVRKMSKSASTTTSASTEPAAEIFGKLMSVPDSAMPAYWELLAGRAPRHGTSIRWRPSATWRGESAIASPVRGAGWRPRPASTSSTRTADPRRHPVHAIDGARSTCQESSAMPLASAAAKRVDCLHRAPSESTANPWREIASIYRPASWSDMFCRLASGASCVSNPPEEPNVRIARHGSVRAL